MDKNDVLKVLKHVYDPDYRDRSIVEMGLIKAEDINILGKKVDIIYGVTAPMCPFSAALGVMVKYALEKELGVRARVKMRAGHLQEEAVNRVLTSESSQETLLEKLREYGILQQCIRV